jgi:hypothetical protein
MLPMAIGEKQVEVALVQLPDLATLPAKVKESL